MVDNEKLMGSGLSPKETAAFNELLRCPFCGSDAFLLIRTKSYIPDSLLRYKIACRGCAIMQHNDHYLSDAVLQWNRRIESNI